VATILCQSSHHVLALDEDGTCLSVEPEGDVDVAECVGAQFVATLDEAVPGLLGTELRVGVSLLFVKLLDGRARMLRFGPILRCDAAPASYPTILDDEDPTLRDLSDAIAHDVDAGPATPKLARRDSGFVRKPDEAPTELFSRAAGAPRIRRRR
jgi:hypothetical protein